MPLTGISRRSGSPLASLTFRELLDARRRAARAARRGRRGAADLLDRIEAELIRRREARLDRAGMPPVR